MTSPPIGTDEELIAKLRAKIVLQRGEVISIDLLDGKGPRPVTTGETVRLINPDGPEAADALQSRISEVERLREALPIFERVTRLAHNLSCDVPITAEARKHVQAAYDALAALSQHRTTG